MSEVKLYLGDCLDILPTLPDMCMDAVITDLPYFNVVSEDWDNQWKTRGDYLDWVVRLAHEWKRVTKDNSSIFVFCDEKMEAYIQVRLDEIFLLLNKIVWFKRNNLPQKNAHLLRTFAPMTERALFYTTQYDSTGWETVKLDMNNFMPLREYFRSAYLQSGLNYKKINQALGTASNGGGMASHYFGDIGQWDLPTQEQYQQLQTIKELNLTKSYEALRLEYEALRRPFNADSRTWDVIELPIIGGDENTPHPTTKPLSLMRRIVSVITNQGQTVFDCCMGSGSTGVACSNLDRNFIGIEKEPKYFEIARKRIEQAQMQPPLMIP